MPKTINNYLVEFIGTLFLVFIILASGNPLIIGATLAFIVVLAGPISGAHVNPAVSVVMASAGKLDTTDLLPYLIAQVLGGLTAYQLYKRYKR